MPQLLIAGILAITFLWCGLMTYLESRQHPGGAARMKVVLEAVWDPAAMEINKPYALHLGGVEYAAIKRTEGTLDFYRLSS